MVRISTAVLLVLAGAQIASAEAVSKPGQVKAAVAAKPADVLQVLKPEDIDPARILPPPPALDSDIQKAELAQLRQIEAQRTQARFDQAVWDDTHQNSQMYAELLGPRWNLDKLPATRRVMQAINNDMKIAATRAKDFFKRPRPWLTDSALKTCPRKADADPLSSYPSGHTIYAFSTGVVLAELMPDKAQAILRRDQDFGYSRMVCGNHYRSDVAGGEALGTLVGRLILRSPKMQADLAAARAELKAAGLTN
jgi:acid phosphatase (class A)